MGDVQTFMCWLNMLPDFVKLCNVNDFIMKPNKISKNILCFNGDSFN